VHLSLDKLYKLPGAISDCFNPVDSVFLPGLAGPGLSFLKVNNSRELKSGKSGILFSIVDISF
jgi:hypothetical protein